MPGTSQGSAHPETRPTTSTSILGASTNIDDSDLPLPQPFTDAEWDAIVVAAVANVAAMEAAETQDHPDEDAVDDLLDAQPPGTAPHSPYLSLQVHVPVSRPGTAAATG